MSADAEGGGAMLRENRLPLDVRIVTYYLYALSILFFLLGLSVITGFAEPQPHRILLGCVEVASRPADSLDKLLAGAAFLFCARGLMRRSRFVWWFSLVFFVYCSTDALLILPERPIGVAVSIGIDIALIVWLWFRKDVYGLQPRETA